MAERRFGGAAGPDEPGESSGEASPVLIVSPDRRDRRQLFDALDRQGYKRALTATNIDQARLCLKQDPDVALIFLDLGDETGDIAVFCSELASEGDASARPVVGILPKDETTSHWNWLRLPTGVREAIRSPVGAAEAAFRMQRALSAGTSAPAQRQIDGPGADSLFDHLSDGMAFLDPSNLTITRANTVLERMTGRERGALQGEVFLELDHSHDDKQRDEMRAALKRDGRLKFQARIANRRGGGLPVEVSLQLGAFDGATRYLAVLRDLRPQRRMEQALRLLGAGFETQLDDRSIGRLLEQCAAWLDLDYALVGVRSSSQNELEVQGMFCRGDITDNLSESVEEGLLKRILGGEAVLIPDHAWRGTDLTDRFVQVNNIESYIGLPLVESNKEVEGILIVASRRRITPWSLAAETLRILANRLSLEIESRRFQADTRSQGLHDTLTLLPNRLLFDDRMNNALKEAQRTGEMFAVLFVDLDRFKTINDSFGHDVGDKVLRGVARRLGTAIRASDTVARYAGDEFTVVLRHVIQREDVLRIARKLNQTLAEPLSLDDGKEIQVTASIGIAYYPDDGTAGEQLIKHADQAMYNAKGLGRNTYQSYVSMPEESHQQKLLLESKLRQAETNDEFRVYYQPQVSAETEDLVGMEALIRWEHPELGLISPGFFIPLAEETGLIVPMGEWVLRTACRQARRWQQRFQLPLRLGVNLSALQLKQPGIVDTVAGVLKEMEFEPTLLDLEVTESLSVKHVQDLLKTLGSFRDLGCSISIDDFGTGQSSLDYIKRFPANRIKIDQSFVRNIGVDPDDAAIVEATINMAHNLNRLVVAEGVEEEQQLEFLRKNGCEELQGYLFCRPLPADAFERLLAERERLIGRQASA